MQIKKRFKKFLKFITFEERIKRSYKTREFKRWKNGWKRHCATRSQMRRIGSRENAIRLGIVK